MNALVADFLQSGDWRGRVMDSPSLPVIMVDTETGGLNPRTHALLSVAAVDLRTGETFQRRMLASGLVDPEAIRVNGLDDWQRPDLPSVEAAMTAWAEWVKARPAAFMGGCNVAFDEGFLRENCVLAGVDFPFRSGTVDGGRA